MAGAGSSNAEIYLHTAGKVISQGVNFVHGLKIDENQTLQSWSDALFGAVFSTAAAASAWCKFIIYTFTILFWAFVNLFEEYHPQLQAAFDKLVAVHRKLSFTAIVIEIAVLLLLAYLTWHRKALIEKWRKFEEDVARKSRLLAQLLPHIAFVVCVSAAAYLLRDFLPFIAQGKVITLLIAVPHAIATYQDVSNGNSATYERHLMYWCIFASHEAVSMMVAYLPLGLTLLSYIPLWRSWLVLSALWMQLPMGTQMVYSLVHPVLQTYSQKLPDVDTSYFSTLVYPLTVAGFIPKQTGDMIGKLARDGIVVVIGGFCMLSLGPLAVAGAIAVCVLMPSYHSLKLAGADKKSADQPQTPAPTKKPSWFGRMWGASNEQDSTTAAQTAEQKLIEAQERWLKYWTCYALLSVFRWVIMPGMWPQFLIGISLWLSTSYFHGAATTISVVEELYRAARNGELFPRPEADHAEDEEVEEYGEDDEEDEQEDVHNPESGADEDAGVPDTSGAHDILPDSALPEPSRIEFSLED